MTFIFNNRATATETKSTRGTIAASQQQRHPSSSSAIAVARTLDSRESRVATVVHVVAELSWSLSGHQLANTEKLGVPRDEFKFYKAQQGRTLLTTT